MLRGIRHTIGVLLFVGLTFSPAVPANARTSVPAAPHTLTSKVIDAHPGYQPQKTCSASIKPGARDLLKVLIKTWGGGSSGIVRNCHSGRRSEHKEGRALDWRMNSAKKKDRNQVRKATTWLTANNGEIARRLGVMYIIWNQHIWSTYYPDLGWRKMENRGSSTANHKDHVHISLSWDGAWKQTSWWTGVPVTTPLYGKCGVGGAATCRATIARTSRSWPFQRTAVPRSFLPAPWKIPGIGGSPQVGRTLTAVAGTWVPKGATLTYQWFADKKAISGATGATFVVTAACKNKEVKVRVTATLNGTRTTKNSDVTAKVYPAHIPSWKP